MANVRKKIVDFPNQIPTPGSAFLYAKKNPNNTYTTSNLTLEQMITLLNDELTFPPSGGTILYSNVYFVDATNGNDGTAIAGDMSKPYASIYAAMDAANTSGLFSTFNRALVYVRQGVYGGILNMHSYVDVYCDPNVTLYGDFRDNTIAVDTRIYGHARFRGSRAMYINGDSNIYIEFDNAEVQGAFIIALAPTESTVKIRGNYIKADGLGTAYGNSVRGKVNIDMQLKEHGTSIQTFMDIRNGYSGKMRLKMPEMHLANGDNYGIDFKNCVFVRDCKGADIKVEAKLINDVTGYIGIYGMFTAINVTNSKFELIGDIEGLDARGINFGANDIDSKFKYSGQITTEAEVIQLYGLGRFMINNSIITQLTDSGSNIITLLDTIFIQCNNLVIQSESTNNNTFYSTLGTNACTLINTYSYNVKNSGFFAESPAPWSININNCVSNVNLNPLFVTDTATPTGLKFDASFNLLFF